MNTVFIVLPILTLLMFELGLTVKLADFRLLAKDPKPVFIALFGQIVLLPIIAFILASIFHLTPLFYIGVILIACCPGGSSSNVFSMLAKGNVALSILLTALSSIITLFTIPFIMSTAVSWIGNTMDTEIRLPMGNLLIQNILLMFLPILLGAYVRKKWNNTADRLDRILSKIAFPALLLLAGIFFVQHRQTIYENIQILGACITLLILLAISGAALLSRMFKFNTSTRRTIVIEVGMQNAAQAIAIASSPFIFDNGVIAIPAIIYALMMNIILLTYVGSIKYKKN
ncbi:MAG: bile acid:sodium symporter family protein [Phocaeicola sp.]|nr:bile acid:sodium symporter family protein [Phocaeicola sp.]